MRWELESKKISYSSVSDKEFQERLAEVIGVLINSKGQLKKIHSTDCILKQTGSPLVQPQPLQSKAA